MQLVFRKKLKEIDNIFRMLLIFKIGTNSIENKMSPIKMIEK